MPKYVCAKHGTVRTVGGEQRAASYCPICGTKTIKVFWLPAIYIDKDLSMGIAWTMLWIGIIGIVFTAIAVPVHLRHAETDRMLKEMPPVWRTLYEQMDAVTDSNTPGIAKAFVESHAETLMQSPLSSQDVKCLMRATGESFGGKVIEEISPYTAGGNGKKVK